MNAVLLAAARRRADDRRMVLPAAGLAAHYDFQQGADAQVLYDLSGNAAHGQLGTSGGSDGADPIWMDTGLNFDGVNDVVRVNVPLPAERTIIVVFTPLLIDGVRLFYRGDRDDCYGGIAPNAFGQRLSISDNYNAQQIAPYYSEAFDSGKPICLFGIQDTNRKIMKTSSGFAEYVDGLSNLAPVSLTHLGAYGSAGDLAYSGLIHQVVVYSRALNSDEVESVTRYLRRNLARKGVFLP